MDIAIIHGSKYGNGGKCAEFVHRIARAEGHNVQVFHIRTARPQDVPLSDVYVVIARLRVGRVTRRMRNFLGQIGQGDEESRYAVVISGTEPEKSDGVITVRDILIENGWRMIGEGTYVKLAGHRGPLMEGWKGPLLTMMKKAMMKKEKPVETVGRKRKTAVRK